MRVIRQRAAKTERSAIASKIPGSKSKQRKTILGRLTYEIEIAKKILSNKARKNKKNSKGRLTESKISSLQKLNSTTKYTKKKRSGSMHVTYSTKSPSPRDHTVNSRSRNSANRFKDLPCPMSSLGKPVTIKITCDNEQCQLSS